MKKLLGNTVLGWTLLALVASPLVRADDEETVIVMPASIVDASTRSDAENDAIAERGQAAHAAWLEELRANPKHPLLAKADRKNAFPNRPDKMRCWVTGFSFVIVGVQNGVCKSAGRKYALSALAIGPGGEIHAGRLVLRAASAFPEDRLNLNGGRYSVQLGIGYEHYDLSNKYGFDVRGGGLGVGLGGAVEFLWLQLTRVN